MKFVISGMFMGKKETLTWEDGKLSSDSQLLLQMMAQKSLDERGNFWGIVNGPGASDNHLLDPYAAGQIATYYLRFPKLVESDVPIASTSLIFD
jgi:hypothetical protein